MSDEDGFAGGPKLLAPGILRLVAPNPGPFTFRGTNTYLIGDRNLAVVDPGPDDDAHLDAILDAAAGRPISHILLTHTHRDHYGLGRKLRLATGAPLAGFGYRSAEGEADERHFVPDIRLADGALIDGTDWSLRAIHTPGHASDHLVFEWPGRNILLSGDHVMGWSTTVIAPPDGSMSAFMASLRKLIAQPHGTYLPGHGDPIDKPIDYMRQLLGHRLTRSASILQKLEAGEKEIPALVAALYSMISPALHDAAALTVHAHLLDLIEQGKVLSDGEPTLTAAYRPKPFGS